MIKLPSLVLLLGLFAIARPAPAAILLYTEQVTGSGSLGSASYTNQPVTLTFTGNTANVVKNAGGLNTLFPGTLTVKVGSGATATFINDTFGAFSNTVTTSNVGLYDVSLNAAILSTATPALNGYDLTTPLATVSGTASTRPDLAFPTNLGVFVLSSTSTSPTFTVVAVPEPVGAALVCGASLLATRPRRRNTRRPLPTLTSHG